MFAQAQLSRLSSEVDLMESKLINYLYLQVIMNFLS